MSFALSRLERIYLQLQPTFGVIPNTGGTATVSGGDACRFIKCTLDPDVATITRTDKTGSRTRTAGNRGKMFGKWSLEQTLAPNGVAETEPDCDPVMQAITGQAPTKPTGTLTISSATTAKPIVITTSAPHALAEYDVVTINGCNNTAANGIQVVKVLTATTLELVGSDGTGQTAGNVGTISKAAVKYAASDEIVQFALWSFRQPAGIDQRVGNSCVVNRAVFQGGQDGFATWTAEGECKWVLSSNQFVNADADQRGGLSAFPTEPASPVTNGGGVIGFTGCAIAGGSNLATIRTFGVTVQPGNVTDKATFGKFLPTATEGDERAVSTNLSVFEDDSTGFTNLVKASQDKAPLDCIYRIGTEPGNSVVLVTRGVQLVAPAREEQRRFIANFPDSPAHGSSLTAKDELAIWFV